MKTKKGSYFIFCKDEKRRVFFFIYKNKNFLILHELNIQSCF